MTTAHRSAAGHADSADLALAWHAVDAARADAERRKIEAQARIDVARIERAAKLEAKEARAAGRRAARLARRVAQRERIAEFAARWRPLVPLIVVNATAMYGQVAAGYSALTPAGYTHLAKLGVALVVASSAELISLYVNWHAHDALLRRDGRTAARLRRAAYLLAGLIGAVNYSHFAGSRLAPTAAAVVFGLMSASSPWLWGLHTRRAQHVQLTAEGRADTAGAVFSGERMRAFPIRTWRARRWSIDHGVSDPIVAWEGYRASRPGGECSCQDTGLPAVPTPAERADMTAAQLRDYARRTYLAAVAAGVPVSYQLLAAAYRMSPRWARKCIAEARTDRTEP